ncbi:MAG: Hsp20/alpha crystallin family protein [Pseudomonadales bacterium]
MTTLTRWNPFREFDDMFNTLQTQPARRQSATRSSNWVPPVDISENDGAYLIELEIPAVAVEDVAVEVKDAVLTVSGERQRKDDESRRSHRLERAFGSFRRSFSLPEDADEESVTASAKDGVLLLSVGKRAKAQPRRITVQSA